MLKTQERGGVILKRINSELVLIISFFVVSVIFDILYVAYGMPTFIQNIDDEITRYLLSALFTIVTIGVPMTIIYIIVRRSDKVQPLTKKERKYFINGLFIFVILVGAANYLFNILELIPDEGIGRLFSLFLLIVLTVWYNQKCVDIEKKKGNVEV